MLSAAVQKATDPKTLTSIVHIVVGLELLLAPTATQSKSDLPALNLFGADKTFDNNQRCSSIC